MESKDFSSDNVHNRVSMVKINNLIITRPMYKEMGDLMQTASIVGNAVTYLRLNAVKMLTNSGVKDAETGNLLYNVVIDGEDDKWITEAERDRIAEVLGYI